MKKPKKLKKRNPQASTLAHGLFQPKTLQSKKLYSQKGKAARRNDLGGSFYNKADFSQIPIGHFDFLTIFSPF